MQNRVRSVCRQKTQTDFQQEIHDPRQSISGCGLAASLQDSLGCGRRQGMLGCRQVVLWRNEEQHISPVLVGLLYGVWQIFTYVVNQVLGYRQIKSSR